MGPAGSQPCCGANRSNISLPVSEIHVVAGISCWASWDFCPVMEMHRESQNTLKIAVSTSMSCAEWMIEVRCCLDSEFSLKPSPKSSFFSHHVPMTFAHG